MSAIIKGKIKGYTNGIYGDQTGYRARFVSDEQPQQELLIPVTSEQWHNGKFGEVEIIVQIKA